MRHMAWNVYKNNKIYNPLGKKSADPALTVLHFCFFKCVYFEKLFNVRHWFWNPESINMRTSTCTHAYMNYFPKKKKDDYTMKENETILVDHSVKAYKLHA